MTTKTDDTDLLAILRDIARPALIWAAHFIFVYAAISAACADRALFGFGALHVAVLIVTVLAVIGAGYSIFRSGTDDLRRSARWSGIISVAAIMFSAAPLILLDSCG